MAKKPDTTTTIVLAAGAAFAAYFLFKPKTASAKSGGSDSLPPPPPDDDAGPPESDPLPPGTPKRNAPAMSMSKDQAISAGKSVVENYVNEANILISSEIASNLPPEWSGPPPEPTAAEVRVFRELYGIPSNRTIASWITDAAYYGLFGENAEVPQEANRGSGWQPYMDVWNTLWSYAKNQLLRGINKH